MILSGAAKLLAIGLTYPYQVVQSRLQVSHIDLFQILYRLMVIVEPFGYQESDVSLFLCQRSRGKKLYDHNLLSIDPSLYQTCTVAIIEDRGGE